MGISLLALTALLLLVMIYTRHRQRRKEERGSYCTSKEESILYVNDYSDGPTTFSQLEEYRDRSRKELLEAQRSSKDRLAELQRSQTSLKAQQDEVRTEWGGRMQ
jgi:hypothetical protein